MLTIWQSFSSRVRPGLFLTLLITLMSVYFITYSAFFESQDSTRIVDAASSLARYGDFGRDETLWRDPPNTFDYLADYPIGKFDPNEPAMPMVVSLWFRIVDAIAGIGLVHGTWLFNIFVVALVCGVFFQYARLLDYSDSVAIMGALLLGLTTALWVYSKTLFREPLVALFLLSAALALEGWRKIGYLRGVGLALVAAVIIVAMIWTKNSALIALPALLVLLIPDAVFKQRIVRRVSDTSLIIVLLLIVVVTFNNAMYNQFSELLLQVSSRFRGGIDYGQEALFTYLFSIGGSVWGTSPVMLLGIAGCVMMLRQGKRRLVWSVVVMIIGYAVSHAYLTQAHWFGGVSWPPRFLIPTLPFVMLAVLPVLEWLMQSGRSIVWRILALLLILYSFVIQVIGGLSLLLAYNGLLPSESNGLHEWTGGLNDLRYLRWVLLPRSWSSVGFDTAWSRLDRPLFVPVYLAFVLLGFLLLWRWKSRKIRFLLPIITLGLVITVSVELRLLYQQDREYEATNQALFEVLAVLEQNATSGEPLLLEANADVTHERFIMNYNRVEGIRAIVLDFPPAEAASEADRGCIADWAVYERETVCLDSDFPPAMLDWYAIEAIDFLAERHDRIWFLSHNSEFFAWSVRPIERYLNERFYLVNEYKTDNPGVRLLEYHTVNAPSRYDFRLPEQTTNLVYDEAIQLLGFTLPSGMVYQAGDSVPITLWWQPLRPLDSDYVIASFIVKSDFGHPPIQGVDSMPDGGFSPTSQWEIGELVWDNRAIELPTDIPIGEYRIWVLLYPISNGGNERLSVIGDETMDDEIGILPVTVTISQQN